MFTVRSIYFLYPEGKHFCLGVIAINKFEIFVIVTIIVSIVTVLIMFVNNTTACLLITLPSSLYCSTLTTFLFLQIVADMSSL